LLRAHLGLEARALESTGDLGSFEESDVDIRDMPPDEVAFDVGGRAGGAVPDRGGWRRSSSGVGSG